MAETFKDKINLGLIGSADFCRRLSASTQQNKNLGSCFGAGLSESWGTILTERPDLLVFEIGYQHNERVQAGLKKLLERLRERFGNSLFIAIALMAPEKLIYGGELLFANETDLQPSGLVDTFLALPPGSIPTIPGLAEQLADVLEHYNSEKLRRQQGRSPLPSLGREGWVQSLADPSSRKLWMKWLPRYATYTNENPIIIGETGTGKTNLAHAMHLLSGRSGQFISITPRDFSSSELVQAELFGAVAGAYTGAVDKWGLVKGAEKGTLFIDELQSIDKDLQGKLITFIENKCYRRVGSAERVEADVRFVFASNKTLYEMIQSEILRHDFAYRLERMHIELQPLRSRRLDITAALAYSLAKIRRQRPNARAVFGLNSGAYRMLFSHNWPGNLRQLENCIAQLCEITDMEGLAVIDENAVGTVFQSKLSGMASSPAEVLANAAQRMSHVALYCKLNSLNEGLERFTEQVRISALEAAGGDILKAAELIQDDTSVLGLLSNNLNAMREIEVLK